MFLIFNVDCWFYEKIQETQEKMQEIVHYAAWGFFTLKSRIEESSGFMHSASFKAIASHKIISSLSETMRLPDLRISESLPSSLRYLKQNSVKMLGF